MRIDNKISQKLKNIAIISTLLLCIYSCSKSNDTQDIISNLLGSEMIFPANFTYQIQDTKIDFNIYDFDFKIITYIDSTECTACMMKLYEWEKTINDLKSLNKDLSIGFVMIIGTSQDLGSKKAIRNELFPYPIVYDSQHQFIEKNSLGSEDLYHTFLLDSDNKILAIGNPAKNPKIKQLYKQFITGDIHAQKFFGGYTTKADTALSFGVIMNSDTSRISIQLINHFKGKPLHIANIVSSCNCLAATATHNTIPPNGYTNLNITIYPNQLVSGNYQQHVDVYYQEDVPSYSIIVNGYINN